MPHLAFRLLLLCGRMCRDCPESLTVQAVRSTSTNAGRPDYHENLNNQAKRSHSNPEHEARGFEVECGGEQENKQQPFGDEQDDCSSRR